MGVLYQEIAPFSTLYIIKPPCYITIVSFDSVSDLRAKKARWALRNKANLWCVLLEKRDPLRDWMLSTVWWFKRDNSRDATKEFKAIKRKLPSGERIRGGLRGPSSNHGEARVDFGIPHGLCEIS